MNTQRAAIQALLDEYAAFNSFDPQPTLSFFHEPAVLVGLRGVFAAPTREWTRSAPEESCQRSAPRHAGR